MKRRTCLGGLAASFFITPGVYADSLLPSPQLTEGPFYPDKLPLDTDNDLIVLNDRLTPAVGEITELSGRVLSKNGSPIRGVTIEIWQCDAKQVYINTRDSGPKQAQMDPNFQGFGKFETASDGQYRFRTIKPVPYPGRPGPHIHIKVKKGDREILTTQLLIRNHPGNARDNIYNGVRDLVDRELILADFVPIPDSKTGLLSAKFDIVLGRTPEA